MNYSVHGPFRLPRRSTNNIDRSASARNRFWEKVNARVPDLPSASGCYIFAMRAGKGFKPFYVGIAEKQPFKRECWSANKMIIYNDVLAYPINGSPILFLIAKRSPLNRLVRPGKRRHGSNDFLESMLIGASLKKNRNLMNIQKTKYLKKMSVPGFLNTPQRHPTQPESEFRKVIN
jgi:hypothetical protein